MKQVLTAAFIAAGLAALARGAGADELRVPVSLTSFGTAQAISSYQMSAAGLALGPAVTNSSNVFAGTPVVMPVAFGGAVLPQSFAASAALNINLALDAGYNLDLAQRFNNYGSVQSPLFDNGNYLGLANGGHYAGVTYAPAANLRFRAGMQFKNDRLDSFTFDPTRGMTNLPLAYDNGEQHSLVAGASWDFSDWAGFDVSGIVNSQVGRPVGLNPAADLSAQTTARTSALNVSAHADLAGGWVTTASFSEGLTQLDQKNGVPTSVESQSYSIAITKHGVFGQDALGFSFSRPSANLLENNFDTLAASGDLPPVVVANNRLPGTAPETDLQLGYVTSFLDGALALQANAAYQMNYQGQTGATSLAILSRAKIKF
ncbi:MAG TPA: hypothetical protein VG798_07280 [Rhizomicrobium sp.]|nr:hypothetical protein [Rhizomicrobium sp.]